MGFFNMLFGGADGIREAMRRSYGKHRRAAEAGKEDTGTSPHEAGLYGALGSRYQARREPVSEPELWMELAPFLVMDEADGLKALTEMVVYQEEPDSADLLWLNERLLEAVANPSKAPAHVRELLRAGRAQHVYWTKLAVRVGPSDS